jgi:hypothetical protein
MFRNYRLVKFVADGVQRGHKDVYWFRWNVSTSSGELFMLLALGFAVEVTNGRERDGLSSLW